MSHDKIVSLALEESFEKRERGRGQLVWRRDVVGKRELERK